MQARGLLMIEHRLIERMLAVIRRALVKAGKTSKIDPWLVDKAIDFFETYADRNHHGKEEDILFRNLDKKGIAGVDQQAMNELIEDHIFCRKTTKTLATANTRYRDGDTSAFEDIVSCLKELLEVYPNHIEKEDKTFFPASRAYFSEEEDQTMLAEFLDFDRKMIHEKYKSVVDELEM